MQEHWWSGLCNDLHGLVWEAIVPDLCELVRGIDSWLGGQ
jgi:hypothetical protein